MNTRNAFAGWRLWLLLALMALGAGAGYWKNFRERTDFVSSARIFVRETLPETDHQVLNGEEISLFFETQIELMESVKIRESAAAEVHYARPELRAGRVSLRVKREPGTMFLALTVTGDEPVYCQAFTDAVVDEFISSKRSMHVERAESPSMSDYTDQCLKEIAAAKDERTAFQQKFNVAQMKEEAASTEKELNEWKRKYADLQAEIGQLGHQLPERRQQEQLEEYNSELGKRSSQLYALQQRLAEYDRINGRVDRAKAFLERLMVAISEDPRRLRHNRVIVIDRASIAIATKPGPFGDMAAGGILGLGAALCILLIEARLGAGRSAHREPKELPASAQRDDEC